MEFIFTCIVLILLGIVAMFKNIVTYHQCNRIAEAIHTYRRIHVDKQHLSVDYSDMRSYLRVFFRFWDWGYKHILPKDKYEKIKKYIG